jgi:AhpD family alkylhydroperoxidase
MSERQRELRIRSEELPRELVGALLTVDRAVHESPHLSAELRELVCLRVSQLNGCAYCVDMHGKELTALGVEAEKIYQLPTWREARLYDARERAALAWAEVLTRLADRPPDDADLSAVMDHFEKDALTALTLAITQINSWNRLAVGFGYEPGHYQAGSLGRILDRLRAG